MQLEYIDCGGNSTSNALDIVAYKGLSEEFIGAVSTSTRTLPIFGRQRLVKPGMGSIPRLGSNMTPSERGRG